MASIVISCHECGTKNRIPDKKQHLKARCGTCKAELKIGRSAIPVELTDSDFQTYLASVRLPVMVDFYSPNCGPCQAFMPLLDDLATRYLGKVSIAKINTNQHPGTAAHYQIRGVPSLLFFKNSLVVDQIIGAPAESELISRLNRL